MQRHGVLGARVDPVVHKRLNLRLDKRADHVPELYVRLGVVRRGDAAVPEMKFCF